MSTSEVQYLVSEALISRGIDLAEPGKHLKEHQIAPMHKLLDIAMNSMPLGLFPNWKSRRYKIVQLDPTMSQYGAEYLGVVVSAYYDIDKDPTKVPCEITLTLLMGPYSKSDYPSDTSLCNSDIEEAFDSWIDEFGGAIICGVDVRSHLRYSTQINHFVHINKASQLANSLFLYMVEVFDLAQTKDNDPVLNDYLPIINKLDNFCDPEENAEFNLAGIVSA